MVYRDRVSAWKRISTRRSIPWVIRKAALFGFCVALVAYNVWAVVQRLCAACMAWRRWSTRCPGTTWRRR
jgi:hypothetical protein